MLTGESIQHSRAIAVWPFLIAGGVFFASINVLVIKIFRYLPASIAVFMSLLNTLSVVLFAYVFTDETLSIRQWSGALLLLTTILLVAYISKKNNKRNLPDKKILLGVGLSVLVALLFGPAILNEKYLIDTLGLETYVLYGWGCQAVSAFILAFYFRDKNRKLKDFEMKIHLNVWLYGLLLVFSGLSFVLSLKNSGSSTLTIVSSSASIVLTVILAYIVLHERKDTFLKLTGLIISFLGLMLLFL